MKRILPFLLAVTSLHAAQAQSMGEGPGGTHGGYQTQDHYWKNDQLGFGERAGSRQAQPPAAEAPADGCQESGRPPRSLDAMVLPGETALWNDGSSEEKREDCNQSAKPSNDDKKSDSFDEEWRLP